MFTKKMLWRIKKTRSPILFGDLVLLEISRLGEYNKEKIEEAKVVRKLIIFESEGEYHCVIFPSKEFLKRFSNKKIVYEDETEGENLAEMREATEKMRNRAREEARKQGVEFVHNIDFSLYG